VLLVWYAKKKVEAVVAQAAKEGLVSGRSRRVDGTGLENPELAATGAVRLGDPGAEAAETAALSK
jgi:hypothetical protein